MKRRIFDDEGHLQFVTFTCYGRRRLLDHDRCKRIVIGILGSQLAAQQGFCVGFVVMPNHVHALVGFIEPRQLSDFMKQWKQRSSVQIKKLFREHFQNYALSFDPAQPVWQARYYPFNVYSQRKVDEKLNYMHENPVRAGLVARAIDWPWSSARYYALGRSVGLPIRRVAV
jgi:putative transposase